MFNKTIIFGNLTQDPDCRFTKKNKPVTTLEIRTTRPYKDAQGEFGIHEEFHRVILFDRLATIAEELCMGDLCLVEGRTQKKKWQRDDGSFEEVMELIAEDIKSPAL